MPPSKSRKTPDDGPESAAAPSPAGSADVFDIARVRKLVELMREFDLGLVDLKQGNQRVRLRRGGEPIVFAPTGSAPSPAARTSDTAGLPTTAAAPARAGKATVFIKSPMVGTFYTSPKPDAPPYVKPGDMVTAETVVCIIEAMKVFNELPAEMSGRIVAVVAETGAPVEYGQPLFEVEPR